jgi:hypothetical protein
MLNRSGVVTDLPWLYHVPDQSGRAPFPKRKWYKPLKSYQGVAQDHKRAPDCRGS